MKSVIRKDEAAVSPVIATILMVAITVVLAAVLYVMVSGLITPVGGNKPLITFGTVSQDGNATFSVAGATPIVSAASYRVNLKAGAVTGTATAMPTSGNFVTVTISSVTYRIYWTDLAGDANLNPGDSFRVTGAATTLSPAGTAFEFSLIWANDGSLIQSASWTIP